MDEEKFFQLLNRELVVALGCTEPIAIAFAAATARKYVKGKNITKIIVNASGNVIKNAMAVKIPGTGSSGINLAAALGSIVNHAEKNLEVLKGLTKEDIKNAKDMIKDGIVYVNVADTEKKLYIEVIVHSESSYSKVIIEDSHTNISLIEVDGKFIKNQCSKCFSESSGDNSKFLNIDSIWKFVNEVDVNKLSIIQQSIDLNKAIAVEGLTNDYGLQVGKTLKKKIACGILSNDLANSAMMLTAAGSDARMAGCDLNVMSNSGSGNQGITATLPVLSVCEKLNLSHEKTLRAVALSHLITIYIKLKFGRLSALCGATIAGIGASSGITYALNGGVANINSVIQNMLGNVTGMLCDGAKCGCALKIATCTNAAVLSTLLSLDGITIKDTDGIIEPDAEKTIDNLCRIGNQGTTEADKIILDIMINKCC